MMLAENRPQAKRFVYVTRRDLG
ncbi:hypothetical protein STRTUCAR8_07607, partial [Streptomyces turgidiscabies Car8]